MNGKWVTLSVKQPWGGGWLLRAALSLFHCKSCIVCLILALDNSSQAELSTSPADLSWKACLCAVFWVCLDLNLWASRLNVSTFSFSLPFFFLSFFLHLLWSAVHEYPLIPVIMVKEWTQRGQTYCTSFLSVRFNTILITCVKQQPVYKEEDIICHTKTSHKSRQVYFKHYFTPSL